MISGHIFIATSVDGFVARTNHNLDWLTKQDTQGEDMGYEAFISGMDGIIMGRGSFETAQTFGEWPYKIPVMVMSKTLTQKDVPAALWDNVRITDLDPVELMQTLQTEKWSRVYVDGGRVVQSFIKCGLVEDIILTSIPILLGDGIRLFGALDDDVDLELVSSSAFKSGLVQNHYRLLHLRAESQ